MPNHEKTAIHQEAVISQALFLQERTSKELLQKQEAPGHEKLERLKLTEMYTKG